VSGERPGVLPRARPFTFPAPRRWTFAVAALLALHVGLALLALQVVFVYVEMVWRAVAGRDELRPLLAAHADQFGVLRRVQAGLWLVTAATFICWVRAAVANLPARGALGVFRPRETTATFLVPVINLIRPLTVLRGLCNASDPDRPVDAAWRGPDTPLRVRWWWALLVAATATEVTASALALRSGGPLDFGPAMWMLIVAQLLTVAAAVLGIAVVLRVHARLAAAGWRPAAGAQAE
jgi:hypothetical protein